MGLIFEPRPPNFENEYNFWRCLNGIKIIFWYLYYFQIFRNQCGVYSPYLKLVFVLSRFKIEKSKSKKIGLKAKAELQAV